MSSHRPTPKKDWRTPLGSRAAAPARGEGRRWKDRPDRPDESAVLRHRAKLAAYVITLATMLVVFVVIIIFKPVPTPALVVRVTGYSAPVPPNSWAAEDARRIAELPERILNSAQVTWESPQRDLQRLCEQLDALKPGGPRRYYVGRRQDAVVIYLSAHGAVDAQGRASLLLPGAGPKEDDRWLPVAELLVKLFKEDRQGMTPPEVNKLLVLDCHKIQNCWNLGVLENSFTDRLEDALKQADVPRLWILASAGSGQRAWSAPELSGSIFGTFLRLGIEGAADRSRTGNGDGIVSLHELTEYLQTCVGHWAMEYHNARQTPVLIGPEGDIPVAYARTALGDALAAVGRFLSWPFRRRADSPDDVPPEGFAPGTVDDRRWQEIAQRWLRHEALAQQSPWTWAPLRWARLEHKLLRMEMLATAGTAYSAQYGQTRAAVDTLIEGLESGPAAHVAPAYSLAAYRAFRGQPEAKAVEALPAPWRASGVQAATEAAAKPTAPADSPDQATDSKPADTEGSDSDPTPSDQLADDARIEPPAPDAPYPYMLAAVAVWERCREAAGLEQFDEALTFLDGAEGQPGVEPVEIHLLRMLHAYLDEPVWTGRLPVVRQALFAREMAERASTPPEARAAYWSRARVDEADQSRRPAEDLLFIGTREALDQTQGRWEESQAAYQEGIELAESVTAAFELLDRAFARLPHLAQWLLEARLTRSREEELFGALHTALDDVHPLAAGLDQGLEEAAWPPQQRKRVERLTDALTRLEEVYVDEALSTRGGDMENLARIRTALRQPLVTGSRRNTLRGRYHKIAGRIRPPAADYAPDPTQEIDAPTGPIDRTARRRLDEMLGKRHPALALLTREGIDEALAVALPDTLEQQGRLIRQWLHGPDGHEPGRLSGLGVLEQARGWVGESVEAIGREPDSQRSIRAQYASIRAPCSKADWLVRAAAPLLAPIRWEAKVPPVDRPAERLQRLDWHHLLVWQAERAVEDFWGPRPAWGMPYFEAASQAYLAAAEKLLPDSGPSRAVVRLRQGRVQAAKVGIVPEQPEPAYYAEDDETVTQNVAVAWPGGIPQGKAVFFLRHPENSLASAVPRITGTDMPDQRRSEIALLGDAGRQTAGPYRIRTGDLQNTSYLDAVALFRGHRHDVRCFFYDDTGFTIQPTFAEYRDPKITVRGERSPEICVMFVFDCSGSMNRAADPKHPKGPTRIQVARDALLEGVDALNDPDSPYHTGLILYAHRTQWVRDPKGPHPKPHGGFDFVTSPPDLKDMGLNPANDVELVASMGHLSDVVGQIRQEVRSVRARGETPLYLAIIEAIETIHPQAEGRKRHIVVLTDGENRQTPGFKPMKGWRRRLIDDIYVSLPQVARAVRRPENEDIQLDVVGFQVTGDERKALEALRGVAENTGGRFHDADDAESLIDALRRSLGLKRFTVARLPEQKNVAQQELDRTADVRCDRLPGENWALPYRVDVPDPHNPVHTSLKLWGGEHITLELRDRPHRLACLPYEGQPSATEQLDGVRIVAHLPYRDIENLNNVRFPVSIENAKPEQFSPRPAEVWAEIRPVGDALPEAAPTFVFYDPTYVNDKPVPVLEFVALDWQKLTGGATEAEIRLWLKFHPTPPNEQPSLAALERSPLKLGGATFAAQPEGPATGIVTEEHDDPERFHWAKVEVVPRPQGIVRRYSPVAGRCRHVFTTDPDTLYQVRITTRDRLTAGAIELPSPLKVNVPSH